MQDFKFYNLLWIYLESKKDLLQMESSLLNKLLGKMLMYFFRLKTSKLEDKSKCSRKAFLIFARVSINKSNYREVFEDYQAHTSNPVAFNTCPYPAETKDVKNFPVKDIRVLPTDRVPGNEKWLLKFMFKRNGEALGGYNVYVRIISNKGFLIYWLRKYLSIDLFD